MRLLPSSALCSGLGGARPRWQEGHGHLLGRRTRHLLFVHGFLGHSLLLFPVAFFTLVFSKLYLVTRAALVPGAVDRPEQLVLANSKLSVGGSAAGMVAGGAGAALLALFDSPWVLRIDIVVYLACAWGTTKLRDLTRAAEAVPSAPLGRAAGPTVVTIPAPRAEPQPVGLPPGGLQLAAVATAGLRAVTGFVTFLLVFTFRRDEAALVWYGLALGASQVGNVAGALLAPKLRRYAAEEWMLTSSSVVVGVVGVSAGLISWGRHWAVAVSSLPASAWRPARASWPSTRWCNVTCLRSPEAARSPASKAASSCPGPWAACWPSWCPWLFPPGS